jgi:hypothetical protein
MFGLEPLGVLMILAVIFAVGLALTLVIRMAWGYGTKRRAGRGEEGWDDEVLKRHRS